MSARPPGSGRGEVLFGIMQNSPYECFETLLCDSLQRVNSAEWSPSPVVISFALQRCYKEHVCKSALFLKSAFCDVTKATFAVRPSSPRSLWHLQCFAEGPTKQHLEQETDEECFCVGAANGCRADCSFQEIYGGVVLGTANSTKAASLVSER